MTWPTEDVDTQHLDSDLDDPALARVSLLDLVQKFNELINHVSSFIRDFLTSVDAPAARATLEVPAANGGTLTNPVINGTVAGTANLARVLHRDVSGTTVTDTTTETTVYSHTIPGGTLGADRMLRLTLAAEVAPSTSSSQTLTVRVKLGATTVSTFVWAPNPLSPAINEDAIFYLRSEISARGADASQTARSILIAEGLEFDDIDPTGDDSFDVTDADGEDNYHRISAHHSVAEDTSLDKTLSVTVQWGTATPSSIFELHSGVTELI